jgi:hypothetical protein
MIYISFGIAITIFGIVFLIIGAKRKWREIVNGALTLTLIGIFIFVVAVVAFLNSSKV